MADPLQLFNEKLASLGQQKAQRLAAATAEKQFKLDPSYQQVQPNQVTDYDPDTMRLQGENFSRRLAAEKPGYSPDAYEKAPEEWQEEGTHRYDTNPQSEKRHKENYALKYGVKPDEVTREDLFREERAQAKKKEIFFKDGRFIKDLGEDKYGRKLTAEVNAEGKSWGEEMSQFEENADFSSPYNEQARLQHLFSGESAAFEKDRRAKTAGEAVGDVAKQVGVSALEMGANLGLEATQLIDKVMNPISWVQMARGKESVGSQVIRELGLTEAVDDMASSARESWLSGPELRQQEEYSARTQAFESDAPHRIQGYKDKGYTDTQAEWMNTKDEMVHQVGDLWNNPARTLNMVAESAPSLMATAAIGRAAFTKGAQHLAKQMGKSVDDVLKDPKALKKLNKITVGAGISGSAVVEGGMAASEMRNKVLGMSPEELKAQSDQYNAYLEKGLSPEEAKGKLADVAANTMFAQMAALAGLTSTITGAGAFESKLLTGALNKDIAGLGIVKATGRGAAKAGTDALKEGAEEVIQSGGEQMLSNITGQKMLGEEGSIFKGVGTAAGAGLMSGAAMGGGASGTKAVIQETGRAIKGRKPSENVPKGYKLGNIAAKYESGGRGAGVISSGKGDRGGKSYGTHQLASKTGTLQSYLKQSKYGKEFAGLAPGSSAFDSKWKQLAANDPGFGQDQRSFIAKTHYEPVLAKTAHLGMRERGAGVQEMLFSTGVQFGAGGASSLVKKALKGKDPFNMTDVDVINAVQDYKRDNVNSLFKSSSAAVRAGVAKRIEAERKDLLGLGEGKFEGQGENIAEGGIDEVASDNNWLNQSEDTTEDEHTDAYYFKEAESIKDASQMPEKARAAALRETQNQHNKLFDEQESLRKAGQLTPEQQTRIDTRSSELESMAERLSVPLAKPGQEGIDILSSPQGVPGSDKYESAVVAAEKAIRAGQLGQADLSKVHEEARPILEGAKAEYQLAQRVAEEKLGERGGYTGPSLQQHSSEIESNLSQGKMPEASNALAAMEGFAGTQRAKIQRHEQALKNIEATGKSDQYGVKSNDPDVVAANLEKFQEEQPLMDTAIEGQLAKYNMAARKQGAPEMSLAQLQQAASSKKKGRNYVPGEASSAPLGTPQKQAKATPTPTKKAPESKPAASEKKTEEAPLGKPKKAEAPLGTPKKSEAAPSKAKGPLGKPTKTEAAPAPEESFDEALARAKKKEPEGRKVEAPWPEKKETPALKPVPKKEPTADEILDNNNVSSNAKGLLAALTNSTELAKRKGNLQQSYPIEFRGKTYPDAKAAYQALKPKKQLTQEDFKDQAGILMFEIIHAKFQQHPRLISEVKKRGGADWIETLSHYVKKPGKKTNIWEGKGIKESLFIEALHAGYIEAEYERQPEKDKVDFAKVAQHVDIRNQAQARLNDLLGMRKGKPNQRTKDQEKIIKVEQGWIDQYREDFNDDTEFDKRLSKELEKIKKDRRHTVNRAYEANRPKAKWEKIREDILKQLKGMSSTELRAFARTQRARAERERQAVENIDGKAPNFAGVMEEEARIAEELASKLEEKQPEPVGPVEYLTVELNGEEVNAVDKINELNNVVATLQRMQRGEC